MSFELVQSAKAFIECVSRKKRRANEKNMVSVAEARAETRKEVKAIRDEAVSKIENELSQLAKRTGT